MKNEPIKIGIFAKEILPEFLPSKLGIEIHNPRISKEGLFDSLFDIGYQRYRSEDIQPGKEIKEPFVTLLSKAHMEFSCFLAYSAGCIHGKYGATLSRDYFMQLMVQAASVGKEYFLK